MSKVKKKLARCRLLTAADASSKRLQTYKNNYKMRLWHHRFIVSYGTNGGGVGCHQNDVLCNYLLWERDGIKFTESSVDGFIANLRATLAYAGLQAEDKIEDEGDAEWADEQLVESESCQMVQADSPSIASNPFHRTTREPTP